MTIRYVDSEESLTLGSSRGADPWWSSSAYVPTMVASVPGDAADVAADMLRIGDQHHGYARSVVEGFEEMGGFDLNAIEAATAHVASDRHAAGDFKAPSPTGRVGSELGGQNSDETKRVPPGAPGDATAPSVSRGDDYWDVRAGLPSGPEVAIQQAQHDVVVAEGRLRRSMEVADKVRECLPPKALTPVSVDLAPSLVEAGVSPPNDEWAMLLNAVAGIHHASQAKLEALGAAALVRDATSEASASEHLVALDESVARLALVESYANHVRDVSEAWGAKELRSTLAAETLTPDCGGTEEGGGWRSQRWPWCRGTGANEGRTGTRNYPAPANTGDGSAYRNSDMFTPSDGATVRLDGTTVSGTAEVGASHPFGDGYASLNVAAHVIDSHREDLRRLNYQNVYVRTWDGDRRMGPEAGGAAFNGLYRPLCYSNHNEQTGHYLTATAPGSVWFGYLDAEEIVHQVNNVPNQNGNVVGYLGMSPANTVVPAVKKGPGESDPFFTVATLSVRRFAINWWPPNGANPENNVNTASDYRTVFVQGADVGQPDDDAPNVGARLDAEAFAKIETAGRTFLQSLLTNQNISKVFLNDLDGPGPDVAQPRFQSAVASGISVTLDSDGVVNAATGETRLQATARVESLRFNVQKTDGTHAGRVILGPIRVTISATVDVLADGTLDAELSSGGIDIGAVDIKTDCWLAFCYGKSAAVKNFVDTMGPKIAALMGQTTEDGANCWGFKKFGFFPGAIIGAVVGIALAAGVSLVTGGAGLALAPAIIGGISGGLAGGSVAFSACSTTATNGQVVDPTFWNNMAGFWSSIIGNFTVYISDSNTNPASIDGMLEQLEDAIAAIDPNELVAALEMADTTGDGQPDTQVRSASAAFMPSCTDPLCTNGLMISSGGLEVLGRVDLKPFPQPSGWSEFVHPQPAPGFSVQELVQRRTSLTGQPFDFSVAVGMDALQSALTSFLGTSLTTSTQETFTIPSVGAPLNFPATEAVIDIELEATVPPVITAEPYQLAFNGGLDSMSNGQPYPYTVYVPGATMHMRIGSITPAIPGIEPGDLVLRAHVGFRAGLGVVVGPDGSISVEVSMPECPGARCPVHVDYEDSDYWPDYWTPNLPSLADEAGLGNTIKASLRDQVVAELNNVISPDPVNLSAQIPNSVSFTLFNGPTGPVVPGGLTATADLPDYVQVELATGAWGAAAFFRFTDITNQLGLQLGPWHKAEETGPLLPWTFGSNWATATATGFPGSGSHTFQWTMTDVATQSTQTQTTFGNPSSTVEFPTYWLTWEPSPWDDDLWLAHVILSVTASRGGSSITQQHTTMFQLKGCGSPTILC